MGISKVNFGGDTLIDLTNDSVTAGTLAKGATAHNAAGEQVVGTLDVKGTFYVTVTQGDGNSATADKTSAEVYAAYAAGYAVYALAKFKNGNQFILPLELAESTDDGVALGFGASGASFDQKPQYISVISVIGFWQMLSGFLARPEDIPAQEQLAGTTGTLTPTQVYDAVSAGVPVKVQYIDGTYGLLSFTAFNVAESMNVIVSQTIVYYKGVYILAELTGYKLSNAWEFRTTMLAEKKDIPTVPTSLKNPNALTIKIGSTTVTYDGSTAETVEIADGSEVEY